MGPRELQQALEEGVIPGLRGNDFFVVVAHAWSPKS